MGACTSSDNVYPAEIPESVDLEGLEVLNSKDGDSVLQAIDVSARAFAGTATAQPPREIDWLLQDVPDKTNPSQLQERVHRLNAFQATCVHYAFNLGRRGLVLVARSSDSKKITGCVMLYLYPQKWSPSIDGMFAAEKACMSADKQSKFSKAQQAFLTSKRMSAMDKVLLNMHKKYATGPHICVQVVAVDPEAQGQGVGRKMMRAVNTIADAMNLPCYLECDDGKNEGVYTKFGYTLLGKEKLTAKENGTEAEFPGEMCAMRRDPVPGVASVPA